MGDGGRALNFRTIKRLEGQTQVCKMLTKICAVWTPLFVVPPDTDGPERAT